MLKWRVLGYLKSAKAIADMAWVSTRVVARSVVRRPYSRDRASEIIKAYSQRLMKSNKVRLEITGAEAIPPHIPLVYVSNHQSLLDVPLVFAVCPAKTLRMVGKQEVFKVPVWGKAMREADFIPIDRKNLGSAIRSIEEAETLIRSGVSIYMAPEGKRSSDGTVGRLKKGPFHLAKNTNTDVVPFVMNGPMNLCPKGSLRIEQGVRIQVKFGPILSTAEHTVEELRDTVQDFLDRNVDPDFSG